jgi:hypothetical protein
MSVSNGAASGHCMHCIEQESLFFASGRNVIFFFVLVKTRKMIFANKSISFKPLGLVPEEFPDPFSCMVS